MKKWLVLCIVVLVVACVAWYLSSTKKVETGSKDNQGGTTNITPKPSLYSTNGTVKQIEGTNYTITLADGKTVKTFSVNSSVEIVKRVTAKSGITLASDKLSSIKIGSEIIVYGKEDLANPASSEVTKIEIIK
jgi:hypothetical protein